MTTPRSQQIDLSSTPYYHVVSRCVRRAYLCGRDRLTRRDFDHRRGWLVERFRRLSSLFAIDVAGFACMSNHYHLILRVDRERARQWSDDEVIDRWRRICRRPEDGADGVAETRVSCNEDEGLAKVAIWRERLHDISWYMRFLNEYIARRANREDQCKGRFWESRFKSQALLDERAILSAMAYVDLNPIRAKMTETLLDSDYTSVQERMVSQAKRHTPNSKAARKRLPYDATKLPALLPFFDQVPRTNNQTRVSHPLPFSFEGYVALVDWTGRQLRRDKRGAIPAAARSALEDLGVGQVDWVETVGRIRHGFAFAIGDTESLRQWCESRGKLWVKGLAKRGRPAVGAAGK